MRISLLCCVLISLLGQAPAYSLPLTPDQVEVRAEQELELRYAQEAEDLEVRFNDFVLSDVKKGKHVHCFFLNANYNEEAITLFKNNLEKASWDVYDGCGPGGDRMLKIVRHNTVPE